jgi:hypothetical protein
MVFNNPVIVEWKYNDHKGFVIYEKEYADNFRSKLAMHDKPIILPVDYDGIKYNNGAHLLQYITFTKISIGDAETIARILGASYGETIFILWSHCDSED